MKRIFFVFFTLCFALGLIAQEKILLEIDDEKISVEEFLYIYSKNNTNSDAMNYDIMKEYMELFENFKLKVHEAIELGLDTLPAFKRELKGYVSSLAQPYLIDKDIEEQIIKEAYERMLYDIEVSHIIIEIPSDYTIEDTLVAYNKIYEVYDKLEKGGDFGELAREYSDDEVSAVEDGSLGYRTVFGLVYEFENIMYDTPVGKYSKPFRTRYGYHILKVTDKRPARGKYKVAHIMKVLPPEVSYGTRVNVRNQMQEIHNRLMNGEDFVKMAEVESDDRKTAKNGGDLGWMTVGGKMIKVFEETVFNLENIDEISPLLETHYGFHIIKLLEKEPIKPFEEVKNNIKNQVSSTGRDERAKNTVLDKLKKEYGLKLYENNLNLFYEHINDSTFFSGEWESNNNIDLTEPVFVFKDNSFTQKDFKEYLFPRYIMQQNVLKTRSFIDDNFNKFVNMNLISYEESVLKNKYPDFKYLINEYHDGILLFDLTDKKVWSKAVKDTVGLQKFYDDNKNNYMWDYRYDVRIYECKDLKSLNAFSKALKKGDAEDKIMSKLNKKDSSNVEILYKSINEKGVDPEVDKYIKEYGIPEDASYENIVINENDKTLTYIRVKQPQPKTISEARGIITADYQNYLEKEWIKELRSKYKIVVHEDVLRSISK